MKTESMLYGVIGLLVGVLATLMVAGKPVNNVTVVPTEKTVGMDEMMEGMMGQTGDDLDRSFLESMIVHHQGAITMANELKQGTKRPELLKLADDIISTQTKEIDMMQMWQQQWW